MTYILFENYLAFVLPVKRIIIEYLFQKGNRMFNVVDSNTFNEQVLSAPGMVLVNFWAWWSDECHKMSSLMRRIHSILDERDAIVQIDWDQQKQFANDLEVIGVPSLLIYIGGDEIVRYSGIMSKDELLQRVLKAKEALPRKEVCINFKNNQI